MTRYYGALCEGLRREGAEVRVPLLASNCDFDSSVSPYTRALRRVRGTMRLMNALSHRMFLRAVRGGAYDCILVTSPEFSTEFLEHNPDAHAVVVVHDTMSCVTAPDGLYDAAGPGLASLLALVRRARLVVCVSHDTRRALLRQGATASERIVVVETGNLLAEACPVPAVPELPEQFLLFVGERSGRKGFFSVVQALPELFASFPELMLVCTGTLRTVEVDFLRAHGVAERVRALPADDGTLVALYRSAAALIYPSLYEGFGLPVLEAMHFGCPVITTRCGALAEVAGEAALFVDPFEPTSISHAVERLLRDASAAEHLRERGYAQSARFGVGAMMQRFHGAIEASLRERHRG